TLMVSTGTTVVRSRGRLARLRVRQPRGYGIDAQRDGVPASGAFPGAIAPGTRARFQSGWRSLAPRPCRCMSWRAAWLRRSAMSPSSRRLTASAHSPGDANFAARAAADLVSASTGWGTRLVGGAAGSDAANHHHTPPSAAITTSHGNRAQGERASAGFELDGAPWGGAEATALECVDSASGRGGSGGGSHAAWPPDYTPTVQHAPE